MGLRTKFGEQILETNFEIDQIKKKNLPLFAKKNFIKSKI